jgi:hypothetical protein
MEIDQFIARKPELPVLGPTPRGKRRRVSAGTAWTDAGVTPLVG